MESILNNDRSNHNTLVTDVIAIWFNCYHIGGQIANFLPLGIDNRSRVNGIANRTPLKARDKTGET